MGAGDNGNLGFQQRGGSLLNYPSSGMMYMPEKVVGMTMSTMPMCKPSNLVDSSFGSAWDPFVSQAQNVEFQASSMASRQIVTSHYGVGSLENQEISTDPRLVQFPSDANLVNLVPKLPCFGSGSFSDVVSSFGLPPCGQIVNSECPSDCPSSNKENGTEITSTSPRDGVHATVFQEDHHHILDEGTGGPSPNGKKRKRVPESHSQLDPRQSEIEPQREVSQEILVGPKEQDDKKQKKEQNAGTNSRCKLTGKQAKDQSQNGEGPKEDYIHVRARRGQATNSHSLAERVRREKISERMRYLQDLVPGCNKITGKAVMLDEIINYVQSLQRQVESQEYSLTMVAADAKTQADHCKFLSMKLATVNPEINIDIEQILSKDVSKTEILHSRGGSSGILGFAPAMSSSLPQQHITQPDGAFLIQGSNPQLTTMSQAPSAWEDELQNVMQLGFVPNPTVDNLGQNGCMKVEL
ncbi:PREDICTED: transcription factor bHLH74-like isoform X2 [Nelumbo nucifera]|uniref:BHLH domain-containing protein n=2 Tax=Nelumbo nucifera TaxID=4432 RepID=A0A822ZY06_NELNU|nr:PREDICTED: transcription factor bHLH74-like isoform X2 [Nelumbo nucifera]DAD48235.1 TPA_asm: hypothetical protein HUJ06_018172 [Nelumbo nucifera]